MSDHSENLDRRHGENDREPRLPSSDVEPDVSLDVPNLNIDQLNLEVENLRAKVSLQAEIAGLVKLEVGADASLDRVALELTGVQAEAMLKTRLERIAWVIDRVLTTIDRDPSVVQRMAQQLGEEVRATDPSGLLSGARPTADGTEAITAADSIHGRWTNTERTETAEEPDNENEQPHDQETHPRDGGGSPPRSARAREQRLTRAKQRRHSAATRRRGRRS